MVTRCFSIMVKYNTHSACIILAKNVSDANDMALYSSNIHQVLNYSLINSSCFPSQVNTIIQSIRLLIYVLFIVRVSLSTWLELVVVIDLLVGPLSHCINRLNVFADPTLYIIKSCSF